MVVGKKKKKPQYLLVHISTQPNPTPSRHPNSFCRTRSLKELSEGPPNLLPQPTCNISKEGLKKNSPYMLEAHWYYTVQKSDCCPR